MAAYREMSRPLRTLQIAPWVVANPGTPIVAHADGKVRHWMARLQFRALPFDRVDQMSDGV